MPEISRFYGIVIAMFYNDHEPPHFHVRYAGHKAILSIEGLRVLRGKLPARALGLAMVDLDRIVRWKGVFETLCDPARFAEVRVNAELGTIVWPNGADVDPDVLYAAVSGRQLPLSTQATRR